MAAGLRLCLDLNIWCAAFLNDRADKRNTATQQFVHIVRQGTSSLGPVQLIISWGMLDRLRKVLHRDWKIDADTTNALIESIANYATLGPSGDGPYLSLGGVNMFPLRDAEDVHVLETALAGNANILITANFYDFTSHKIDRLIPGKLGRYTGPKGEILIAHPSIAFEWFKAGAITLPA